MAIAPDLQKTIYAGGYIDMKVIKSTDGGSTWVPANSGLPNRNVLALAIDPTTPATLYAAAWNGGVYKSTDAGMTWTGSSAGLGPYIYVQALAIDPITPTTIYAGEGNNGMYKSTNAGGSWAPASTGLTAGDVNAVIVDPNGTATLYAATPGGGVYKSTNAAGNWAPTNAGLTNLNVAALVMDPSNPATLYAGTVGGGVFKSTDSGATWVASYSGLTNLNVGGLVIDPEHPTTIYAATSGTWTAGTLLPGSGVFRSTDSGATWVADNPGLGILNVGPLAVVSGGETKLYAGTTGGVWQLGPAAVKGDMNLDGASDLVFRSNVNGAQNRVWLMNGVNRASETSITPDAASADWKIRGVHDFDADGRNDLVFWNQVTGNVEFWLMNGASRTGAAVPLSGGPVLSTAWDLSATADFNADGRPDIVWRNFTSQKIVIWTMNGSVKLGNIIPTPAQAVDSNWAVVAALDYNADGNTDFLWYNATSGKIVTWHMNASVVRTTGQFTVPANAGDNNWKVLASSDYSGPSGPGTPPLGSPDIVWRNETSGNQVVWHMDFGSTRVFGQFTNPAANTPALGWTVVGPR